MFHSRHILISQAIAHIPMQMFKMFFLLSYVTDVVVSDGLLNKNGGSCSARQAMIGFVLFVFTIILARL